MTSVRIEKAMPNELPEAAFLASRAMIDLPENKIVFSGRRHRMEAVFRILFTNCPGRVLLAKKGDSIAGVMRVVEWPECRPPLMEGLRLLPFMASALKGSIFKSIKLDTLWTRHDPKEHHWHIDPIAVKPEIQRQGVGGLLMDYYCRFVDSRNSAGYLETGMEENVRFYEKFGFSVIGESPFYDAVNWFMWRPKQSKVSSKQI